jgi:hypothetical protein
MAAKPRVIMGKLLHFPVRTLDRTDDLGAKPSPRSRLDHVTGEMIAAEQALFVALRLAQKTASGSGDQPPIQPPPRTSSSRKKTAA